MKQLTPEEKGVICGLMDLYKSHYPDNTDTNRIAHQLIDIIKKKFYSVKRGTKKLTPQQNKFILWIVKPNQGNFTEPYINELCISILNKIG
jgi:hypothetical protein